MALDAQNHDSHSRFLRNTYSETSYFDNHTLVNWIPIQDKNNLLPRIGGKFLYLHLQVCTVI